MPSSLNDVRYWSRTRKLNFPLFTVANTFALEVLLLSRRSWPPQNAGIRACNGLLFVAP
jgi:hypothetical protein